jgi:hypothetical protein
VAAMSNLKEIDAGYCKHYQTPVTFFIETSSDGSRKLIARYAEYTRSTILKMGPGAKEGETYLPDLPKSKEGNYDFAAAIPADWTEDDVLRFLSIGEMFETYYPVWEMPARRKGEPVLSWPVLSWPKKQ